MKHVVIAGHPDPNSFTLTIARAYCDAVTALGHEVVLRDLYRIAFDPLMKSSELASPGRAARGDDIAPELAAIAKADVITFVYPMWFNAPPAIIKGYMDRVFGLAGGLQEDTAVARFDGKGLLTFTSSGEPSEWLRQEGGLTALRNLFDEHFAAMCGLKLLEHIHFRGITPRLESHILEARIADVRKAVARLF